MLSPRANAVGDLIGRWVVVGVWNNHERKLARELLIDGVGYFLPMHRARRRGDDRGRLHEKPVFPGFLFVCCPDPGDLRGRLARHHWRHHPHCIAVADERRLVAELTGIHNAIAEGKTFDIGVFLPGRRCVVVEGPYRGQGGEIDRLGKRGRVFLNLSTLGQTLSFETDIANLEPV